MKPSKSLPPSQLKELSKQGIEPTTPAEKPVESRKEEPAVDISNLARALIRLRNHEQAILARKDGLKERLELAEKITLNALRDYAQNPDDTDPVDKARENEASDRKRLHLNTDSLKIVQSDLKVAEAEYDEANQRQASRLLAQTKKVRQTEEPRFVSMMRRGLLEVLVTQILEGASLGRLDIGKVVHKAWPGLKQEVEQEATRIRMIAGHSLEAEALAMEAENEERAE